MQIIVLAFVFLIVVAGIMATYFLLKQQQQSNTQLFQQVESLRNELCEQMRQTTGQIDTQLSRTVTTIRDVHQSLGQLSEAAKNIQSLGEDMSSLQEILQAPKMRGGFGEYLLEKLLADAFPAGRYELNHQFKSGEKVDAVIKFKDRLVPIDAKFPLENFKKMVSVEGSEANAFKRAFVKDVKKHIDDIARKYILPIEGTLDFALMYIPAENIYYEAIIKDEKAADEEKGIFNYAVERHVIPVSPATFYAYLQAIVYGLRGLEIQKIAKEVLNSITQLRGDLRRFNDDFDTLGSHLTNAKNKYDDATKKLERFDSKLSRVEEMSTAELPDESKEGLTNGG